MDNRKSIRQLLVEWLFWVALAVTISVIAILAIGSLSRIAAAALALPVGILCGVIIPLPAAMRLADRILDND